DLIPALLATWRVGALYLPMDIGFPKQRIAYMLSDAAVQAVITNRDLTNMLEDTSTLNLVYVEEINSLIAMEQVTRSGTASAYIMYTSGSTGKPKGVEIRHSALVNALLALKEYQELTPASSMLALTTISFDVSTNELFTPLIAGGCVELGEDG